MSPAYGNLINWEKQIYIKLCSFFYYSISFLLFLKIGVFLHLGLLSKQVQFQLPSYIKFIKYQDNLRAGEIAQFVK